MVYGGTVKTVLYIFFEKQEKRKNLEKIKK